MLIPVCRIKPIKVSFTSACVQHVEMLEVLSTPRGVLRAFGEGKVKEKFSCLLDLALRAAAYAAMDYTDPT